MAPLWSREWLFRVTAPTCAIPSLDDVARQGSFRPYRTLAESMQAGRITFVSQFTLQRLGGAALLVGGVLFSIGNLLHPTEHSAEAHEAATWTAAHVTFMIGMLGILLGLPALYVRVAQRTGLLGLIGYTAFFLGVAWTLGGSWFEAFGIPALDEAAIHDVEHGPGVPYNIVGALLFVLGQIAFGVALYRARVQPRAAALAMVASGLALLPASGFTGPVAGAFLIACTAILGISLAAFGRVLLAPEQTPSELGDAVVQAPSQSIA